MAANENKARYVPRWRVWLWKLLFVAAALLVHAEWWPWWPWRIVGLVVLPIALFEWAFAAINAAPRPEHEPATHH